MPHHPPSRANIPSHNFTHLLPTPSKQTITPVYFIPFRMSIFLLVLLVGVAVSRYTSTDRGDHEALQPIISKTRQRRICAELCMSGLGGDPCGEGCVDLIPDDLPVQYVADTHENTSKHGQTSGYLTRHKMCDVLCDNNLGNPLCQCNVTIGVTTNANFFEGKFKLLGYLLLIYPY